MYSGIARLQVGLPAEAVLSLSLHFCSSRLVPSLGRGLDAAARSAGVLVASRREILSAFSLAISLR